ncbi:hypothetical protein CAPTEDRAFT_123243 [Capitella teleta]|uniref:Sugar phosphate transporter domain-containing protein n=1 Tax=Capitella teleta TaxID=283909 RepID=R7TBD8_CAPTE|nr:hypothetical protein CAPTEDRAFT_123243 [Capitella teleta]|eukprot:ELT88792.1 hypothetical protein CAPTEDRAFT_123243 [Capitella teleta]
MGKKHRPVDEIKDFVAPRAELVRRSVCSLHFLWETTKTIGLVLFYYVFSISLTFYNQRFIHMYRFPLSITMCHLVTKFIISGIIRCIWSKCSGEERISLGWCDFIKRIAPPGIASSLDIALSNWSFEYISISLYTMTKSTVIIFIMFFSIVFKLEKPRWSLISIIGCISLGLFMFTYDSTQFHLLGFLLVFSASFLSGLRWTLSQLVMQKSKLGQ